MLESLTSVINVDSISFGVELELGLLEFQTLPYKLYFVSISISIEAAYSVMFGRRTVISLPHHVPLKIFHDNVWIPITDISWNYDSTEKCSEHVW